MDYAQYRANVEKLGRLEALHRLGRKSDRRVFDCVWDATLDGLVALNGNSEKARGLLDLAVDDSAECFVAFVQNGGAL